jgi:hypothetical protein
MSIICSNDIGLMIMKHRYDGNDDGSFEEQSLINIFEVVVRCVKESA